MRFRTLWMPQAEVFIKSLAPEPRRALCQGIEQLADGKTAGLDLRALEGELQGHAPARADLPRDLQRERRGARC